MISNMGLHKCVSITYGSANEDANVYGKFGCQQWYIHWKEARKSMGTIDSAMASAHLSRSQQIFLIFTTCARSIHYRVAKLSPGYQGYDIAYFDEIMFQVYKLYLIDNIYETWSGLTWSFW